MSFYEISLYVLSLVVLIIFLFKIKIKPVLGTSIRAVLILMLILQVIFGGPHTWYLFFFYGLIVVLSVYIEAYAKQDKIGITFSVVMTVLVGFAFLLTITFSIPNMPETSGSFDIGTKTITIHDTEREELYNADAEYRKFVIQVWYPADISTSLEKAKWLTEGRLVASGLCEDNGLPSFTLNHLAEVESNSYLDADILDSTEPYPVVIISHGWRGFKTLHTDLAEELASNGYVVISIDHTYGSVATIIDDEVIYNYDDALPGEYEDPEFLNYANVLVNTYAGDVLTTLDRLPTLNNDIFNNLIDLDNIGLLGHSTGGGGDVTVALQDDRITSLIGLDAWVEPIETDFIEDNPLDIPLLFLRSSEWEDGDNNDNLLYVMNGNMKYSGFIQIVGTTHIDFTMTHMMSNLTKQMGLTGDLDAEYLNQLLESIILEFFNSTLKEETYPDFSNYNNPELRYLLEYFK